MKYIKILILVLLFANCNQNLRKLNGHWKVYTKLNIPFDAEQDPVDEETIFLDKFNLGYNLSINTLDITDNKLIWNRKALIKSPIKGIEMNQDNKTFILTHEKGESLKLGYHINKDSIFIEDTNKQLKGYAVKTNPTVEDMFITSPVNIVLLKSNNSSGNIIKEVNSDKDILVLVVKTDYLKIVAFLGCISIILGPDILIFNMHMMNLREKEKMTQ